MSSATRDERRIRTFAEQHRRHEFACGADEVGAHARDQRIHRRIRLWRLAESVESVDPDDAEQAIRDRPRRLERDLAAHRVADQHDLPLGQCGQYRGDIGAEGGNRPVLAIAARPAVPGEIHCDDGVGGLQVLDLRPPVIGIAGPAMDQDDERPAVAVDAIVDVHAVRCERDSWRTVGDCRGGRRRSSRRCCRGRRGRRRLRMPAASRERGERGLQQQCHGNQ